MATSYADILSQPAAKKPSRRAELLRLAMEILTLATIDESPEGPVPRLTGQEPEIYVAPRYSPSP